MYDTQEEKIMISEIVFDDELFFNNVNLTKPTFNSCIFKITLYD